MKLKHIELHCQKCNATTPHYTDNNGKTRCKPCVIDATKKSKAGRARRIFDKKMQDIANNIVQPRQYNMMKAPIYTGEKWVNARCQMTETKPYIGAVGTVDPVYY